MSQAGDGVSQASSLRTCSGDTAVGVTTMSDTKLNRKRRIVASKGEDNTQVLGQALPILSSWCNRTHWHGVNT